MKRISQSVARKVASNMRQKFWEQKFIAVENEASANITKILERYIPSGMRLAMDVYEKHFGDGITRRPTIFAVNRRTLYLTIPLQKKYQHQLTIGDADHDSITNILKEYKCLIDKARQYEKQVEETLLQLKTQSKVKEFFPEANEFIQWDESSEEKKAITTTVEELRKLLKQSR